MNILFINGGYPSPDKSIGDTFVQQFVWAMARCGHTCTVINPTRLSERRHGTLPATYSEEEAGDGAIVRVYRPRYQSFSSKKIGWFHTGRLTNAAFRSCAVKCALAIPHPDIIYGHFLYPAGSAAIAIGSRISVPSVIGVGEGEFWTLEAAGSERAAKELQGATAFLANSTLIAENLTKSLGIPSSKIRIFPNGVSLSQFQPTTDRKKSCHDLGLSPDYFNIGFIGPPVEKKGYPQLRQALRGLSDIRLILIGRGMVASHDPQVSYAGSVHHSEIPNFLRCCDIFVLPTKIEGSCNSVIEAMACGLPIITSNGRHMDDIVDDSVAIRLNTEDTDAIRNSVLRLKNDKQLMMRMSKSCLAKAKQLDINIRARQISTWMKEICP